MNLKQRILTYAVVAMLPLTVYFVPWRVMNGPKASYVISPYWRPIVYDEGGPLRPFLLYAEWGVLAVGYLVLLFFLRSKKPHQP